MCRLGRCFVIALLAAQLIGALLAADTDVKFAPCKAADAGSSGDVLVIDIFANNGSTPRGHFLQPQDRTALNAILALCPKVPLDKAQGFFKAIDSRAPTLRVRAAGAGIDVFVFHQGPAPKLTLDEEARRIQIYDDFGRLATALLAMRGAGGAGANVDVVYARLTSSLPRATLTLTLEPSKDAPSKKAATTVATIVTGPTEHFRLSANLPVNSTHVLTYDLQLRQPALRQTPKEFLVGGDVYLDDVLTDWRGYDLWRRFGVKALCQASLSAPLDSLGVVGAFRWNQFSVFAGPIWTRITKTPGAASGGIAVVNLGYKRTVRVGLGVDPSTAVSWFSKKKSS